MNLIAADKRHTWHPFTQMRDWCAPEHEPLVLSEGEGPLLRDSEGREYIDGNSSIWTNIHGHRHPKLNAAIRDQLERVAHTSFLGFTNPPAIRLAEELVALWPEAGERTLSRVFFSDDGATAIEVAIKMAVQYWQHCGKPERSRFIAFSNAYHGDTMGASSLGGINAFHSRFSAYQFPVVQVGSMEELSARSDGEGSHCDPIRPGEIAAVIIEPLVQGAGGVRFWPRGMLGELRAWCDRYGVLLITDEVMTAFGRTGAMFASQLEGVMPDFVAMAKGLTGGYLPLAATLTTEKVYEAFLGEYSQLKSFFYGHSFTGSQLGCAAALASLAIFREERVLEKLAGKIDCLARCLASMEGKPNLKNVRQCGFIAAFDLVQSSGEPFDWTLQTGEKVCLAARKHGLLTRPIRDTLLFMPPYCITEAQIAQSIEALRLGVEEVCLGKAFG
jgi:adenosylmethionine-8-amino-7-oxononanoate aminotransferase